MSERSENIHYKFLVETDAAHRHRRRRRWLIRVVIVAALMTSHACVFLLGLVAGR